ncbi:SpoIIE family protein phosphatase, partial [candidate division KSB3 bacterium]|nr:SpoIIE family protein phosphatase [candidate division KSB3 bacterium]MBD3324754.1 SpoIIE family protein phosphatase [candidate division KSB3 bacterium]
MKLYYEWGTKQLYKRGEELCGDSIVLSRQGSSVTLALSDGLGSGVKANILATLTTQIAMHMLENELSLGEVVQTLGETLPVDRVRKLAYSTFAIAQFFSQGYARVVEFDTPATILLRRRKVYPVMYEERSIEGKTIRESHLDLEDGDW